MAGAKKKDLRFADLVLAVVSLTVALLISELVLRWMRPHWKQDYSVSPSGSPYQFYQFDERLGWSNAPGMKGVFEREEFRFEIRINEHGMRQGPVSQAPQSDEYRIAFLGDSFLWGFGVEDSERYPDIVGADEQFEALNFGVSGYAPVQYLLQVDSVLRFQPNHIFVAICSNDFYENVHYRRYGYFGPYAELKNEGEIEIKGYPLVNVRRFGWKAPWSAGGGIFLVQAFRRALLRLQPMDAPQAGLVDFRNIYLEKDATALEKRNFEKAVRVNLELLRRIRDRLWQSSVRMTLIISPSKNEYLYGEGLYRDLSEIMQETARELKVPLLNPVPLLTIEDFWANDGHWRPGGHEKIARAVLADLKASSSTQ